MVRDVLVMRRMRRDVTMRMSKTFILPLAPTLSAAVKEGSQASPFCPKT